MKTGLGKTIKRASRRTSARRAAFTLLETLVGSLLLVIVLGALLLSIAHGYSVMRASRESLRATQIVLERMEGLRLYNWNQLVYSNMVPTSFTNYFFPPDDTSTSFGVAYYGTMTISNVDLDPPPSYAASMRQVTVSVTWNSDGVQRQRSMSTFVSQNGIQNYIYAR